jgi:hypothetical protein
VEDNASTVVMAATALSMMLLGKNIGGRSAKDWLA